MSADLTTYNKELLASYRPAILHELVSRLPDLTTPEWRAWADQWREIVPLTNKQQRENAARARSVKKATAALAKLNAEYRSKIDGIGIIYGVTVVSGGCGCDDGDDEDRIADSEPPHKPTYQTKPGAPPEPQKWRSVEFRQGNITRG